MKPILKLAAITLALTCSFSINAKTYKLATNTPSDSPTSTVIKEFVDLVKEQTDSRVSIRVFWNGSLGGQTQYVQQIESGVVDMGLVSSATLENIQPIFGVLNLPYIFRSLDEYRAVMNSDYIQNDLIKSTKENGFEVLGFISNGFRSLYTVKPINSADDLKNLKIRTMSSETYIEMLRLMGMVPVPLDFTEVYSGLQQGMIDGAEGSLASMWENKFGEVCKYGIRTEQTRLTDFIVVSNKALAKMSVEDADIVRAAMKKAGIDSLDIVDAAHHISEKKVITEMGGTIIDLDKEAFINMMKPLYQKAMNTPEKKAVLEKIFEIEKRSM